MLKKVGVFLTLTLLITVVSFIPARDRMVAGMPISLAADPGEMAFLENVLLQNNEDTAGAILTKDDIRKVQDLLERHGYSCGGIDGIMGPRTANAIHLFRKDRLQQRIAVQQEDKPSFAEIRINIPEFALTLLDGAKVIHTYDIAVGTPYEQTPTGRFAIFSKIENPTWFPGDNFTDRTPVLPGPDNPLGTRWMEFIEHYGIHGTNKDWDILYPVSGGCIRMHDAEARQLFEVVPVGTPVTIVYETMKIIEKDDGLYLKIFPDIYQKNTSNPEAYRRLSEPFAAAGYTLSLPPGMLPQKVDEIYETKIGVRAAVAVPEPFPRSVLEFAPPKSFVIQKKR